MISRFSSDEKWHSNNVLSYTSPRDMHIADKEQSFLWSNTIYFQYTCFQLTPHACRVYHHMGRIYFRWKVWKVKTFWCREIWKKNPYLRLRLETLLARLAKLANEILEAWWKDIQNMKIWKEAKFCNRKNLIVILGMAATWLVCL